MSQSLRNYDAEVYKQAKCNELSAIRQKAQKIALKKARKNKNYFAEYGQDSDDDQEPDDEPAYYNEDD